MNPENINEPKRKFPECKKYYGHSFGITINPTIGVDQALEDRLVRWLQKREYQVYNIEYGQADVAHTRHMHAQIWQDTPTTAADIRTTLNRILENNLPEWDSNQKRYAAKVKIAWDDNYMDEYITKDSPLIIDNPPLDSHEYYPTKEQQQKFIAKANCVDPKYYNLEEKWQDSMNNPLYTADPTPDIIKQWLNSQMFIERKMAVVECPKRRNNLAKCLFQYISKNQDYSRMFENARCQMPEKTKGSSGINLKRKRSCENGFSEEQFYVEDLEKMNNEINESQKLYDERELKRCQKIDEDNAEFYKWQIKMGITPKYASKDKATPIKPGGPLNGYNKIPPW